MNVAGGAGGWTGTGYTEIPYLKNTRIAVELKGAVVNDCYELVGGIIESVYNPNWWKEPTESVTISKADPNVSLAQLQDEFVNYKATDEQKVKIDQLFIDLKNQLLNDTTLTGEQRTASLISWEQARASWDTLKTCTSAGGRIATGQGRVAAGNNCSKDTVVEALKEVNTNTTKLFLPCIAPRPTNSGQEGQTTITTGTSRKPSSDGVIPEPCRKTWYYFAGAAPNSLLRSQTFPSITDWSAGWYSRDEYIARVSRIIKAIVLTTNDVKVIAPGTDLTNEVAIFDEFVNSRTVSQEFLNSIAADYERVRRTTDFSIVGSGQIEPVYIEFDALTLFSLADLKAIVRASAGLAKAGIIGAKKGLIAIRLTQLHLADISSDGVLKGLNWLEKNVENAKNIKNIELKDVKFVDPSGETRSGSLIFGKFNKGIWQVVSGILEAKFSSVDDIVRLFDKNNSLNSINRVVA